MIFLCDIGGTNCRLSVKDDKSFTNVKKYKVTDYPDFETIFSEYIKDKKYTDAKLYMGLAANPDGKIYHFRNQAVISNNWKIDPDKIRKDFNLSEIHIFDDFVTNSMAIPYINNNDCLVIRNTKIYSNKPKCIIGVGTGLGLSYAVPIENNYHFIRTFGGHIALSSSDYEHKQYIDLLSRSLDRTAIFEDFLAGSGFLKLHNIISEVNGYSNKIKDDEELLYILNNNKRELDKTLNVFAQFYGLFAHISVSTICAYGGLYLTGGVTDSLIEKDLFYKDEFIKSFEQNMVPVVSKSLSETSIFYPKIDLLSFHGLLYAIDNNIKGENV